MLQFVGRKRLLMLILHRSHDFISYSDVGRKICRTWIPYIGQMENTWLELQEAIWDRHGSWRSIFTVNKLLHVDGQMDRFFCAKKAFHIHTVGENAKNRTKNWQNPRKKLLFSSRLISGDLIWSRPNQAGWPDMVWLISGDLIWPGSYQVKLSQMAGRARKKEFFSGFLSCFLHFHQQYVYEMPFLQKRSVHLAFSSRRNANCNCLPRIGGHHFLLCQHTTYKYRRHSRAIC